MELYEAIRLGAMLRPKATRMLEFREYGIPDATCALGAAYEAVLGIERLMVFYLSDYKDWPSAAPIADLARIYPELLRHPVDTPAAVMAIWRGDYPGFMAPSLSAVIQVMNDQLDWSREQVAAWLEARAHAEADALVEQYTQCVNIS